MKVHFMYCRKQPNISKKIQKSFKKIKKMSEEETVTLTKNLENYLDSISDSKLVNIYSSCILATNKVNLNKSLNRKSKEIQEKVKNEEDNIQYVDFFGDKLDSKINGTFNKVVNRLMKIMNSKMTKVIIFGAFTIIMGVLCYLSNTASIMCATTGGLESGIERAFFYIRVIAGIFCFIFMTLEIIQNAVSGDFRAIWYICAKYLAILTIILSYKTIYDIIDKIFNA